MRTVEEINRKQDRATKILNEIVERTEQGQIFGVTFTKKDGSVRTMAARLGVGYDGTGADMGWNPLERGYIPVYDMNSDFKMLNTNGDVEVRVAGETLDFPA